MLTATRWPARCDGLSRATTDAFDRLCDADERSFAFKGANRPPLLRFGADNDDGEDCEAVAVRAGDNLRPEGERNAATGDGCAALGPEAADVRASTRVVLEALVSDVCKPTAGSGAPRLNGRDLLEALRTKAHRRLCSPISIADMLSPQCAHFCVPYPACL